MSKLFLDLKKFKKIKEDDDSTTFEHEHGHQIVVKSKALTPAMKEQMDQLQRGKGIPVPPKKLAQGGEAKDPNYWTKNPMPLNNDLKQPQPPKGYMLSQPDSDKEIEVKDPRNGQPQQHAQPEQQSEVPPGETYPAMEANGGQIRQSNPKLEQSRKMFAGGGDTAEKITEDAMASAPVNPPTPTDPQGAAYAQANPSAMVPPSPVAVPEDAQGAAYANAYNKTPAPAPEAPQQDQGDAGPAQAPSPQQDTPAQAKSDNMLSGIQGGIAEQRAGIQQQAAATGQQSQDTLQALQHAQQAKAVDDSHYQTMQTGLLDERNKIFQDIQQNHIKPNQYLSDMSVPGRIATGIGLLLGGISSGITGQDNPAMKFLSAQIDRNIDAQAKELGKKENLLSANYRQFQNIQQARDFTRVNHNDMLKGMIEQAAAKAGTPMAKAAALQAMGQLDRESGMLQAKVGAMQTINHAASGEGDINSALQTLRWTDPAQAKEIEGRLVPGVGIAQVPISEGARQQLNATQDFDLKMKNLYTWAQQHSGEMKLTNPTDVNYGKALAQSAQNAYRTAQDMGVYKKSEAPLLEGELPSDPTAFLNKYRVLPQYKAVLDNNALKFNSLRNSYQIRPFNNPQQQQQAAPARFTPAQTFKPRQ